MICFLYRTTCSKTGKFYIGVHKGQAEDSYLGSGLRLKASIKKYGKDFHRREIMEVFPDLPSALAKESLVVDDRMLENPLCMNLKVGGRGGFGKHSEESKLRMSMARRGRKFSKLSEAKRGKSTFMKGRKHRKESIDKLKANHVGMTGKKHSPETIEKMRAVHRGKR